MSFLHLWPIYVGAAAVALPVIVHWLTKPRPVRYPISTLRFVREAVRQRRSAQRLRDWLILALRSAAVLLIAWAIARPLVGERSLVGQETEGETYRVVILDASQSMAADEHGISRFERGRAKAASFLQYAAGLRANLIQAAAAPRGVFDEPSSNLQALHDELDRLREPRPERLNAQAAIVAAAEMLGRAPSDKQPHRELIVVSDFQRTNWTAVDFSVLPDDTRIQLEPVDPRAAQAGYATAEDAALPNLAILRAGIAGHPAQGTEATLEVEIANNSSADGQPINVEVTIGAAAYRLQGTFPKWNKITLSQPVTLGSSGWLAGQARLVDVRDSLAADNARPFVVRVRPAPVYALVSREARGSSFYLERALAPFGGHQRAGAVKVVRVAPTQFDAESLAAAELIALDHPGKLSADAIRVLGGLLRRGRAVLYIAAEPVDAINLKQLSDSLGSGLQMPVEFSPPPAGRPRRDLFLVDVHRDQPPFSVFGDSVEQAIGQLRFSGGLASRRLAGALADDIVASFNDQSAALVITATGAGTLAVLNADLGASSFGAAANEAAKEFPIIVHQLVERMLGQSQRSTAAYCGETAVVPLPPEVGAAKGLKIVGPAGSEDRSLGELAEDSSGVVWRVSASAGPGVYQIQREGATVFATALEIPSDESDLRSIDEKTLTTRLSGGRQVQFHATSAGGEDRDDLWTWLAVGCVLCILAELIALRVFKT